MAFFGKGQMASRAVGHLDFSLKKTILGHGDFGAANVAHDPCTGAQLRLSVDSTLPLICPATISPAACTEPSIFPLSLIQTNPAQRTSPFKVPAMCRVPLPLRVPSMVVVAAIMVGLSLC